MTPGLVALAWGLAWWWAVGKLQGWVYELYHHNLPRHIAPAMSQTYFDRARTDRMIGLFLLASFTLPLILVVILLDPAMRRAAWRFPLT